MPAAPVRRLLISALFLVACDAPETNAPLPPSPPAPPPLTRPADAALGRAAFRESCANCHTSIDGFDLAYFGYADSTILRRGTRHVDTLTAHDIVAHIRTISTAAVPRTTRPLQPGGTVAASDADFSIQLFGRDAWPADLTVTQLRAIAPQNVVIALPLPLWSDEASNLDWLPDSVMPDGLLDDAGGQPRTLLAAYHASPTTDNLLRALTALRAAERRSGNPAAPCVFNDAARWKPRECFDARRWQASLVLQHLMRSGMTERIEARMHDTWWDVGIAAMQGGSRIDYAAENWAAWTYLSWIVDPVRQPSALTADGLVDLGLRRHATFVALRSLVSRVLTDIEAYADIEAAANVATDAWVHDAVMFGLRALTERVETGDLPRPESRGRARSHVDAALDRACARVTAAQCAELRSYAEPLTARLGGR